MAIKPFLIKNKGPIVEKWIHLILETYPVDASRFVRQEKDRFVNPFGYTLSTEIEALYEGLVHGMDEEGLSLHLEKIIQIRSVQDFSASRAVAIVLLLKKAIRDEMEKSGIKGVEWVEEWLELEGRIDQLCLTAFDIYTKYRERIYEIRIREVKGERDRMYRLLERTHPEKK